MSLAAIGDGLSGSRRAGAIAAVLTAMGMVVIDANVANIALPSIAKALEATPARSVLVVTAYQTALISALLPCGALGERFGHRRVFVAGVAVFVAASILCALAPSLPWLVAARFVQGLGGAAVMALGVALLRFSVAPDQLGRAISWNALTVAISSAAAPSLGSGILAFAGWPWLFAINLPIGVLGLLAARTLPPTTPSPRRIDLGSVALNAATFIALVAAGELLALDWRPAAIALAISAVALHLLIRRETGKPAPLIPLDLLSLHGVRVSAVASVLCFTGQTAALVALPFWLHHAFRLDTVRTGMLMTTWPLTVAASASLVGRLADRLPSAWLCAAGAGLLSAGLAGLAAAPTATPTMLIPLLMLSGLGFAFFQTPNNRNLFLASPPDRSGAVGGLQGTARLTGQTFGALLVTLLMTAGSMDAALRIALGIGSLLTAAAAVVSLAGRRDA